MLAKVSRRLDASDKEVDATRTQAIHSSIELTHTHTHTHREGAHEPDRWGRESECASAPRSSAAPREAVPAMQREKKVNEIVQNGPVRGIACYGKEGISVSGVSCA